MTLQITPFGLIIASPFYLLAGYLLWRLWRRLRNSGWRYAVPLLVPVAALLPFADELWIAWRFEQACREAGVKVYRTVEVEGFVNATNTAAASRSDPREPKLMYRDANLLATWDKQGYRFKEQMLSDGGVWHVERRPDGVYGWTLDQPIARHRYQYADPRKWVPVGWKVRRMERQVVDTDSGEILGRQIYAERYPNFIEQLWMRYVGSGRRMCPDPEKGPRQPAFPESLLIPKNSK